MLWPYYLTQGEPEVLCVPRYNSFQSQRNRSCETVDSVECRHFDIRGPFGFFARQSL